MFQEVSILISVLAIRPLSGGAGRKTKFVNTPLRRKRPKSGHFSPHIVRKRNLPDHKCMEAHANSEAKGRNLKRAVKIGVSTFR